MTRHYLSRIAAAVLLLLTAMSGGAEAQKPGGVLRIYHRDSPASMSIHEEGTNSVSIPMMAVFNNLVLYDQHVAQNSLNTIVPDLAESWSWSEDGTRLTFKLREGVKWHDGAPFTSADVKCTWDLLTGRVEAREIMARLGYGPNKRLAIEVAARNIPTYRDPAVILID